MKSKENLSLTGHLQSIINSNGQHPTKDLNLIKNHNCKTKSND